MKIWISMGVFALVMTIAVQPLRDAALAQVNAFIARIPVSPIFTAAFIAILLIFATHDLLCRGGRA